MVLKWKLSVILPFRGYTTCFDAFASGTISGRKVDIRRMVSGACVVNRIVVDSVETKRRGTPH